MPPSISAVAGVSPACAPRVRRPGRCQASHPGRRPVPLQLVQVAARIMEEEEGDHEAYQSGDSSLISGVTMRRAQPPPCQQGGDNDMGVSGEDPMADWDQHVTLTARSTNLDSTELDSYLSKVPIRRSDQFNILAWWQTNSAEYPTLSRMAADILAAPASSVASESAFSTGKRVLSDFRSRMTPTTLEALVCLQDWIRATANTQRSLASVHDVIMDLQDNED